MKSCRQAVHDKWAKNENSVMSWARTYPWFPSSQQGSVASMSERRRLLDQGAVTINGRKPRSWDCMPLEVDELVFFKGSKRQTTVR